MVVFGIEFRFYWAESRIYGIRHMVKDHSDSERKPTAATWATLSN